MSDLSQLKWSLKKAQKHVADIQKRIDAIIASRPQKKIKQPEPQEQIAQVSPVPAV